MEETHKPHARRTKGELIEEDDDNEAYRPKGWHKREKNGGQRKAETASRQYKKKNNQGKSDTKKKTHAFSLQCLRGALQISFSNFFHESCFSLCMCFAYFSSFSVFSSHSYGLSCRSSPSRPSSLSSSSSPSSSPSFPLNSCLRAVRLWYLLRSFCLFLIGVYHQESSVRSKVESHCCQHVGLPATGMLRVLCRYS